MKSVKVDVLAVAWPAQGHIKPLMKLCRQIAKQGLKVTMVNIQSIHDKLVAAADRDSTAQLASIPDVDDQDDALKLMKNLRNCMPQSFQDLMQRINSSNPEEKIRFVIADISIAWILDLDTAEEMGAEPILFSPASAAFCALMYHIPTLLEDGILDLNGNVKNCEKITLWDDIPGWGKDEIAWSVPHEEPKAQKSFFDLLTIYGPGTINQLNPKLYLINTCYELESSACNLIPKSLPIGPLLDSSSCNFYPEDASCLSWLDTKAPQQLSLSNSWMSWHSASSSRAGLFCGSRGRILQTGQGLCTRMDSWRG